MSPEEKSLLERTYKIAEENNVILKSMRSTARWGLALRVSYWVLIIALSFGAYYFIQPYLESLYGAVDRVSGNVNSVKNMASQLGDLLK